MISVIQILLIAGVLLLAVYSYRLFRSSYLDAILIILFLGTGVFFIFFPDTTTKVAHLLGVGRGADMIFYLSILFFAFLILKLYAKVRKLQQEVTTLVRKESIDKAIATDEKKSN